MPAPVRRTRQRTAVATFLASTGDFRTAQQIHSQMVAQGERLGLATVYRTVQAMAEAGEVDVRIIDGESAYRRCSTSAHHHHLVCRSCGHTEELTDHVVEAWAAEMATQYGFTNITHDVELSGTCSECADEA